MNAVKFHDWLISEKLYTNSKLIKDCVSRVARVERAFQLNDPGFSFEEEFRKDRGKTFKKKVSRRGITIEQPINLPIGTNQMYSIVSAINKYFLFLEAQAK